MRTRLAVLISALVLFLAFLVWRFATASKAPAASTANGGLSPDAAAIPPAATTQASNSSSDSSATNVHAHNLMLRKGPSFRVYVRWLDGQMARARRNVNPSFDDPESFYLDIKTGILRANIGDIGNFMNAGGLGNSPLRNITLSGNGDQIKLNGTLHKVIPLPIELTGVISALPDSRIKIHVTKLNVVKIPFKALLGRFHITIADLIQTRKIAGLEVAGNDLIFDPQTLLPPPHIRGRLTAVHIVNPDLEEIYGDGQSDETRMDQWRNFLRLRGGTIDFGKLTMHHVDLIMIDVSKDPWFDLDLANYQQQLVNGYTRMTPTAGLQIFMPDLRDLPQDKTTQNISIEWLKNRNAAPPADVLPKKP